MSFVLHMDDADVSAEVVLNNIVSGAVVAAACPPHPLVAAVVSLRLH